MALPPPITSGVASKFMLLGTPHGSLLQALSMRGVHTVSLMEPIAGTLSLTPDYGLAYRLAIEHLQQLGHIEIAIVLGPGDATKPRRITVDRAPLLPANLNPGSLAQVGASRVLAFPARSGSSQPRPTFSK